MIIKLIGKVEFKYCNPFTIKRAPEVKCDICHTWEEYTKGKNTNDCFDGDIFLVTDIHSNGEDYILEIGKGKYSELIYAKQTGKLHIHSLFVASYIVTSDNYFCFVMDNGNRVNTIGGMADKADFINGVFAPEICLAREIKEELGVNLYSNNLFCNISAKYLKLANEEERKLSLYPIGILYEITSTLTKMQLTRILQTSKEQVEEQNIKPVFYAQKDFYQLEQYENKVSYIMELISNILKE